MNEINIIILSSHTERKEGETHYLFEQRCIWQSIRRYKDLEVIMTVESMTSSDTAKKFFLETVEEIHKDIRRNVKLVRKLLNLGEHNGFSGDPCISFAKTGTGYKKYYDYWGGLAEQWLGKTFRDALLIRVKSMENIQRQANKRT